MSSPSMPSSPVQEGAAFPWILEHLLTYPGTFEIPLRTMYTLNATITQTQQQSPLPSPSLSIPGNAFPPSSRPSLEEQHNLTTATAAAQLRANLITHISQLPSQPTSLPPSFITSFVRKCFPQELHQVDFPQALTAMDYLKDLEVRRRREVVAALDKLGVERSDLGNRDQLAKKYPGVLKWVLGVEEKERKVEALYTQVYVGIRRWTLINELSLTPFNKSNCIAMLNTLYPPVAIQPTSFVQPTAQLTPQILSTQRNGFFRYITAVERSGTGVLSSLMDQHRRPGEATGWTSLRETLDSYLRMANSIIDECYDITGRGHSPLAASFSLVEYDEEGRRKVDSGISFGSAESSNRSSGQSHFTRPSTSSSMSTHSRQTSKEKQLPEKPLPVPAETDDQATVKSSGSTLERIARELRKMKSRSNMREESHHRPTHSITSHEEPVLASPEQSPQIANKGLRFRQSLKKMRSSTSLREPDSPSRPSSRAAESGAGNGIPAFDAEEMKYKRQMWEAQQQPRGTNTHMELSR